MVSIGMASVGLMYLNAYIPGSGTIQWIKMIRRSGLIRSRHGFVGRSV